MSDINLSLKRLFDSGCHFGHATRLWNPRMKEYIYCKYSSIHILDLRKTILFLEKASEFLKNIASRNGRILFVGTKRVARDHIKKLAEDCGQYHVVHRWFGGTLTNWSTISNSILRLREYDELLKSDDFANFTKKEQAKNIALRNKLHNSFGGIADMGGVPDAIFVIDVTRDALAVAEAKCLNIPVVSIVDSDSDPTNIDYPIPGNDDSRSAIQLYCQVIKEAVLSGMKKSFENSELLDEGSADQGTDVSENISNSDQSLEVSDSSQKINIDSNDSASPISGLDQVFEKKLETSSIEVKLDESQEVKLDESQINKVSEEGKS